MAIKPAKKPEKKPLDPKDRKGPQGKRAFVGVNFGCCKVYSRVYLTPGQKRIFGWCPRCGARLEFRVASDGSDRRFFSAT